MKISAKTRYALAAVIKMAQTYGSKECTSLITLAESLKISKIYLEQVFSLLKRAGVVTSVKGAQGGYLLAKPPREITVYQIMEGLETSLFASNDKTVEDNAPNIEEAMQKMIFEKIDTIMMETLASLTLESLANEAQKHNPNYMYYL